MTLAAPVRAALRVPHYPRELRRGLAEYFPLADLNGAVGGTTLTNNNGATFGAGQVGNAVHLASASSQYLSAADSALLSTGDILFSVAMWVYLASKPGNAMAPAGQWAAGTTDGASWRLQWQNTTDRFRFQVATSVGGAVAGTVPADTLGAPALATWYLLAAFHDPVTNQIGISVNGGPYDLAATTNTVADATPAFTIGCDLVGGTEAPTRFWDGRIDEVAFWKGRILTPRELRWLYHSGRGRVGPF